MNTFLSVCMIVKNEEKVLRRCLESIVGIADEIIIADTGSNDKTKNIALEFTDQVFDYIWEDDFSKARNFVGSKASGDWILVIDADEYVDRESFTVFKQDLFNKPPSDNILAVKIVNFVGINGKDTTLNYHERLYKNNGLINYYRSIHELLVHKDSMEKRGFSDLIIYHSGYMKDVVKEKEKSKRNLSLLLNKKVKEPIDYYFIGNEYDQLGILDKAINNYQKGFKLSDNINRDWVKKLLLRLVHALHKAKRNNEALEIAESCEKIFVDLVDFKYYKGQIYFDTKEYNKAKLVFEEILLLRGKLKADSSIDFLELLPNKILGQIYEIEKEFHKAVQHYTSALSINDADEYIWARLINLLANHSSLEELSGFLNNNLLNKKNMTPVRVIKILLSVPNLNVQKLTRSFLNELELSQIEIEALLLKNLQLDGCIEDIKEILNKKSSNEIIALVSIGIFNIIDFIIFSLEIEEESYKKIIFDIKFDNSLNNLLVMLFKGENRKLSEFQQEFFIILYKQSYVLHRIKILEKLDRKFNYLTSDTKDKLSMELSFLIGIN